MRKLTWVLCLAAVALLVLEPSKASAAYQSYIAVKGKKQGALKGQAPQPQQSDTKSKDDPSKSMQRRKNQQ